MSADVATVNRLERAHASSNRFAFIAFAPTDPALAYALALARENMKPYLQARGREFDELRWRTTAPRTSFFTIADSENCGEQRIGFLSVRQEDDCSNGLHIGDVQIEPNAQSRGAGSAALRRAEFIARAWGKTEVTLNVFYENPAIALYERCGFKTIDHSFDKFKMRKELPF